MSSVFDCLNFSTSAFHYILLFQTCLACFKRILYFFPTFERASFNDSPSVLRTIQRSWCEPPAWPERSRPSIHLLFFGFGSCWCVASWNLMYNLRLCIGCQTMNSGHLRAWRGQNRACVCLRSLVVYTKVELWKLRIPLRMDVRGI